MISCLGPRASFSHICALKIAELLHLDKTFLYCFDFEEVYNLFKSDKALYAVLPVENSLGGGIGETLDKVAKASENVEIKLEYVLKIEHNLISFSKDLSQITEIRAHEQALAQCKDFLKENFPNAKKIKEVSNSGAVESLVSLEDSERNKIAAICSKESSEFYNVPIIISKVNDSTDNYTRFWLLGKKENKIDFENSQKLCSFAFQIPFDEPGGLIRILQPLGENNLNLTRIESRPTRGKLAEYTFFIDTIKTKPFDFYKLASKCSYFKFLGEYPVLPEGDFRFC